MKLLKLKWEYGNLCELTEFLGCEECKECYVEVDGEGGFEYSTSDGDIYGKLRDCWSKCEIKRINGDKYYVKD